MDTTAIDTTTLLATAATGLGATALLDAWSLLRRRWFATPLPDYGLLGRWLAHMRDGRFRHAAIARATPAAHERALGWIAHYATGVGFAVLLVAVAGRGWLQAPTLLPALTIGVATVVAPWALMQPGMGAGFAARRAPRPWRVRSQNLVTHAVFGLGLYAAARVVTGVA